jgi:isoamylase
VTQGHPLPLGANLTPSGVNFALICRHATAIWLVLSEPHDPGTLTEVALDPRTNRTGDHWHIRVDGLPEEFCYGYRAAGPSGDGHRYDPSLVLLDPASRALFCGQAWGSKGNVPRRRLVNTVMNLDQDDTNPCTPREETIIYELHVRGYTIDPSSDIRHPGTFAGLMEKITHLKALGVTAVELLPIDEFADNDCPFVNRLTSSCPACAASCTRPTSTASGSTWPRSSAATAAGMSCSSHR